MESAIDLFYVEKSMDIVDNYDFNDSDW